MKTCATCQHIGGKYHQAFSQMHYCTKSDIRRRETMRSTGDFAQDFMNNFRAFFDASVRQKACNHYSEAEPLSDDDAEILAMFDEKGLAEFKFFSRENSIAGKHPKKL